MESCIPDSEQLQTQNIIPSKTIHYIKEEIKIFHDKKKIILTKAALQEK